MSQDPLDYLLSVGMPLEKIQWCMDRKMKLEELAAATESMLSRGMTMEDILTEDEPEPPATSAPELAAEVPKPKLMRACDVPYEPPRWTIAPYFQVHWYRVTTGPAKRRSCAPSPPM